ncbi:MAG: hypothetical protein ACHQUC_07090 [Chlamydiales bacterium]
MPKKFHLILFILILIALILIKLFKPTKFKPILLDLGEIVENQAVDDAAFNNIEKLINSRNATIKSIVYSHVRIKVERFNLTANIFYEKERKFRMITRSFLGKESDIGSNDDIFWFWSKRLEPCALYYAKHEDLYQTNLRTPFHPLWMMEILGIGTMDLDKCKTYQHKENIAIVQNKISVTGTPVTRIYLIDPQKLAFVGHYIYDSKGSLVVSAEITDFYNVNGFYLPKTAVINWAEEDVQLLWSLDCPILNNAIDPSNWKSPPFKQKINLKGYIPSDRVF